GLARAISASGLARWGPPPPGILQTASHACRLSISTSNSGSVTVRIVMRTLARTLAARTLAILVALLAATAAARAAEINAFVSTAIKTVTDELLPPFERASGTTIRA